MNIGSAFDPSEYVNGELTKIQKMELCEMLRSTMACLKMETWEYKDRVDIAPDYYNQFIRKRLGEWPYYTMEKIHQREFDPNNLVKSKEAFSHLNKVEIGKHNAFLARAKYEYNLKWKDKYL